MNKLSIDRQTTVVRTLCEGNPIRGTAKLTGVAANTVVKLLRDLGSVCLDFQDETMRDLTCTRLKCDAIWSFVYSKAKDVHAEHLGKFGYGNVWTWTAIDSETKLVPCWHVGDLSRRDAWVFMNDLAGRLSHRVQLTTDDRRPYLEAVEGTFGSEIDYATLTKLYNATESEPEALYSPAECIGTETRVVQDSPDTKHISTSYVERQNQTMRMSMRSIYSPNECVQQEARESHVRTRLVFRALQFRAAPHESGEPLSQNPSHGSRSS